MNCGLFHLDACISEAWDSITGFVFGWFFDIPWGWLIAGLIIGSILGAKFGWLAVISLGTSVLVGVLGPRILGDDKPPTDIDGPDVEPVRTVRKPRERRTLRDLFRRKTRPD